MVKCPLLLRSLSYRASPILVSSGELRRKLKAMDAIQNSRLADWRKTWRNYFLESVKSSQPKISAFAERERRVKSDRLACSPTTTPTTTGKSVVSLSVDL